MRMSPHSFSFALVLGAVAALPSFGIDMSLPADRIGRKPIMLGAVALFAIASFGCAGSYSLVELLVWRVAQGMGAGVGTTLTMAVINDLFEGETGRAKISHLASVMLFVPMLAPTAGTMVLAVGNWRSIYGLLALGGFFLFCVVWLLFGESARLNNRERFSPATLLRGYSRALRHPVCLGYILVNAAAFAALFAYISGSSLLLIDALNLSRAEYSMIYAATFAGVMASVLLNGRLSVLGVAPGYALFAGITVALGSAGVLVAALLAGWTWVPALAAILVVGTMGFGLIAPNAIHGAMHPLPDHAGAVSAMAAFVQVLAQSASSALVVSLNGREPGLSMAVSMLVWSALGLAAYVSLARPAEIVSQRNALT
jgi:DHA1 family bicyclomycin/chloramphenicol resistance-like MFS transporter